MDDPQALAGLEFQTMITLTKVEASELAAATVMSAMRACGLSGYRNDSEFSLGRHLRDVLSSPIMINNDRILSNLATPALMSADPHLTARVAPCHPNSARARAAKPSNDRLHADLPDDPLAAHRCRPVQGHGRRWRLCAHAPSTRV